MFSEKVFPPIDISIFFCASVVFKFLWSSKLWSKMQGESGQNVYMDEKSQVRNKFGMVMVVAVAVAVIG